MAIRMLLKTDSKLPLQFLRNPSLARPHLSAPIEQPEAINKAFLLSLNGESQHAAFSLGDFLGAGQKLFTKEASFTSVRDCFQNNGSTLGGALCSRRVEARRSVDAEDEDEDEDDDVDFEDDDMDYDDDDFEENDLNEVDESDDDDDDKVRKRKK